MAVTAWLVSPPGAAWNAAGAGVRLVWLAGVVGACGGVYLAAAWLLDVDEVRRVPRWLSSRLFDARASGR